MTARSLDEIYRLLKVDFDDSIFETNDEQKAQIAKGIKQIENGEIINIIIIWGSRQDPDKLKLR